MNALVPHPLITEARSWLGTPYQRQGRSKRGVDGFGLIKCLVGFESDVDVSAYSPLLASGEPFLDVLDRHLKPVPFRHAGSGDIVCFRTGPQLGACVNHFAVLEHQTLFTHAYFGQAVRSTHMVSWWARRLAYAYRLS